jgi:hypothetical protein
LTIEPPHLDADSNEEQLSIIVGIGLCTHQSGRQASGGGAREMGSGCSVQGQLVRLAESRRQETGRGRRGRVWSVRALLVPSTESRRQDTGKWRHASGDAYLSNDRNISRRTLQTPTPAARRPDSNDRNISRRTLQTRPRPPAARRPDSNDRTISSRTFQTRPRPPAARTHPIAPPAAGRSKPDPGHPPPAARTQTISTAARRSPAIVSPFPSLPCFQLGWLRATMVCGLPRATSSERSARTREPMPSDERRLTATIQQAERLAEVKQ